MAKNRGQPPSSSIPRRGTVWWRAVYWGGRTLQVVGLVLIWWVLLLFANMARMGALLQSVLVAAVVFYTGWACATRARKSL